MKNNYLLLAEIIKMRRIVMGFSLRSLSNLIGISHTELTRMENGSRENYNLTTIINLCNILKLDFVKLLKITGYLPYKDGEIDEETLSYIEKFNKINYVFPEEKNDVAYIVLEVINNE